MKTTDTKTYFPGFKTYKLYPGGLDGRALFKGGQNYRWACEFWGKGWSARYRKDAIRGAIKLFFGLKPVNNDMDNDD